MYVNIYTCVCACVIFTIDHLYLYHIYTFMVYHILNLYITHETIQLEI